MVVRCVPALKERILSNASNLKEKLNSKGDGYYINKQLPESIMEQNREIRQTIKEIKDKEEKLPVREKSKIEVKHKTVFTDGKPVVKELMPPEPMDLFPDDTELEKMKKVHLSASDVVTEKSSDFQAYALKTGHMAEVKRAYKKVRRLHPAATHVIGAFIFKAKCGFQDDNEYSAGHKLLAAIKQENMTNVAVFVCRAYGGINLGPKRHQYIKDVALQAISRIGKEKEGK